MNEAKVLQAARALEQARLEEQTAATERDAALTVAEAAELERIRTRNRFMDMQVATNKARMALVVAVTGTLGDDASPYGLPDEYFRRACRLREMDTGWCVTPASNPDAIVTDRT